MGNEKIYTHTQVLANYGVHQPPTENVENSHRVCLKIMRLDEGKDLSSWNLGRGNKKNPEVSSLVLVTLICRITGKFNLEDTSGKHLDLPLEAPRRTEQIFRPLSMLILQISKSGQQYNLSGQPFLIFDGLYKENII